MRKLLTRSGLVAVMLSLSSLTHALSITVNDYDGVTDYGPNPDAFADSTGAAEFFSNVVGNQFSGSTLVARTPYEGTPLEDSGEFSSVLGSVTYTFSQSNELSFLWGSPDRYNTLTLEFSLGGSSTAVDIIPGTTPVSGDGWDPFAIKAQHVSISGIVFDTVTFKSTQRAFEYAGVSAVPVPAAAWLFGTFLLGIAGMNSRKRRS